MTCPRSSSGRRNPSRSNPNAVSVPDVASAFVDPLHAATGGHFTGLSRRSVGVSPSAAASSGVSRSTTHGSSRRGGFSTGSVTADCGCACGCACGCVATGAGGSLVADALQPISASSTTQPNQPPRRPADPMPTGISRPRACTMPGAARGPAASRTRSWSCRSRWVELTSGPDSERQAAAKCIHKYLRAQVEVPKSMSGRATFAYAFQYAGVVRRLLMLACLGLGCTLRGDGERLVETREREPFTALEVFDGFVATVYVDADLRPEDPVMLTVSADGNALRRIFTERARGGHAVDRGRPEQLDAAEPDARGRRHGALAAPGICGRHGGGRGGRRAGRALDRGARVSDARAGRGQGSDGDGGGPRVGDADPLRCAGPC